jgi:hypothetical protein
MKLAVYTTIYPGVQEYLAAWYSSLQMQADQQFDLWIGLDDLTSENVEEILQSGVDAQWVPAQEGATPAEIRQRALLEIAERYDGVVLVDSDDLLHPSRVAAARAQLVDSDLAACALSLIDQKGKDLRLTFDLPAGVITNNVLPRNNVFGFSNSAFRTSLLRRCLPVPAETVLMDWLLASRAWLMGVRLAFESTPRMSYRQHPANTARVRCPFSREQVISDTNLVRKHFQLLLAQPVSGAMIERERKLEKVAAEVETFHEQIVLRPGRLDGYVQAINATEPAPLWWTCVANPALENMWTEQGAFA